MSEVNKGRFASEVAQDGVVVFLIGMRINRLWQVNRWLPVATAMPKMVAELVGNPSLGLLTRPKTYVSGRVVMLVQYWRSFEELERYARSSDRVHLPAWRAFNNRIRDNGSVGVWHETYRVGAGQSESIYVNMPDFGLAQATTRVPASQAGQSAAHRIGLRDDDSAPVEPY